MSPTFVFAASFSRLFSLSALPRSSAQYLSRVQEWNNWCLKEALILFTFCSHRWILLSTLKFL